MEKFSTFCVKIEMANEVNVLIIGQGTKGCSRRSVEKCRDVVEAESLLLSSLGIRPADVFHRLSKAMNLDVSF